MCIHVHVTSIIIIKLYLDPFSSKDAADISEKLTKLSAEGAKAVCDEFREEKESCSATAREWNDWRVFMRLILDWESSQAKCSKHKRSKPKREFLLKLISIADRLTNKSDADKLQELASSYLGQCNYEFVYHVSVQAPF